MVRSRSITEEINTLELVARGDHPNIVDYYCTLAKPVRIFILYKSKVSCLFVEG